MLRAVGRSLDELTSDVARLRKRREAVEKLEEADRLEPERFRLRQLHQEAEKAIEQAQKEANARINAAVVERRKVLEKSLALVDRLHKLRSEGQATLRSSADPSITDRLKRLHAERTSLENTRQVCEQQARGQAETEEEHRLVQAKLERLRPLGESGEHALDLEKVERRAEALEHKLASIVTARQRVGEIDRRLEELGDELARLEAERLDWRSVAL